MTQTYYFTLTPSVPALIPSTRPFRSTCYLASGKVPTKFSQPSPKVCHQRPLEMSCSMWQRVGDPPFFSSNHVAQDITATNSYSAATQLDLWSFEMLSASYITPPSTEPVERCHTSHTSWSQQPTYDVPSVWPNSISLEHLSTPEQLQLQHFYAFLQDKGRCELSNSSEIPLC